MDYLSGSASMSDEKAVDEALETDGDESDIDEEDSADEGIDLDATADADERDRRAPEGDGEGDEEYRALYARKETKKD